jgi:hypothetical protein
LQGCGANPGSFDLVYFLIHFTAEPQRLQKKSFEFEIIDPKYCSVSMLKLSNNKFNAEVSFGRKRGESLFYGDLSSQHIDERAHFARSYFAYM